MVAAVRHGGRSCSSGTGLSPCPQVGTAAFSAVVTPSRSSSQSQDDREATREARRQPLDTTSPSGPGKIRVGQDLHSGNP